MTYLYLYAKESTEINKDFNLLCLLGLSSPRPSYQTCKRRMNYVCHNYISKTKPSGVGWTHAEKKVIIFEESALL